MTLADLKYLILEIFSSLTFYFVQNYKKKIFERQNIFLCKHTQLLLFFNSFLMDHNILFIYL